MHKPTWAVRQKACSRYLDDIQVLTEQALLTITILSLTRLQLAVHKTVALKRALVIQQVIEH